MLAAYVWNCCNNSDSHDEALYDDTSRQRVIDAKQNENGLNASCHMEEGIPLHPSFSSAPQKRSVGSPHLELVDDLHVRIQKFKEKVVTGMPIVVINLETGQKRSYFFQMDRFLTTFSLKMQEKPSGRRVRDFLLKDVTSIYSDRQCVRKARALDAKVAMECVGIDTLRADQRIFFHFSDPKERAEFLQYLKIIKLSVNTLISPQRSPLLTTESRDIELIPGAPFLFQIHNTDGKSMMSNDNGSTASTFPASISQSSQASSSTTRTQASNSEDAGLGTTISQEEDTAKVRGMHPLSAKELLQNDSLNRVLSKLQELSPREVAG